MQIEVWSDVACPWCYIGKRRLEAALARFDHRDEVTVTWRAFELDPSAPAERPGAYVDLLAGKYGTSRQQAQVMIDTMRDTARGEGLDFRFDRSRPGNTFDAHRLIHLAGERGVQDAVKERLLAAYLTEGASVADQATLVRLAGEAGLDPREVETVLASGAYAGEVRAEEAEAMELGISGVPFFVIDRRFAVPGAQSPDVLLATLERAWARRPVLAVVGGETGPGCDGDTCTLPG